MVAVNTVVFSLMLTLVLVLRGYLLLALQLMLDHFNGGRIPEFPHLLHLCV